MSKFSKGLIITIMCAIILASMLNPNLSSVAIDDVDPGKPGNITIV